MARSLIALFTSRLFAFTLLLLASRARGAEPGPDFSKLAPISACPAVVSAAQDRLISLEGIDPPAQAGLLAPGDSFTALVTLCEKGGRRTQWLLCLHALPASPKELSAKPPAPMVVYSGRSNRLEYVSAPALVRLETIGLFAAAAGMKEPAKVEDQSACFSLDKGYLGLGLERAAATICRAEQTKTKGFMWFGADQPDAAKRTESRKFADDLRLTLDEERALGGMFPALLSYFGVVEHTEGLEDILLRVIQKPSIWSIVRHVGVTANLIIDSKHFCPADQAVWGLPANSAAYHFPILVELNHQLALTLTLVVTSPRPPLLTCGGIIGMLAEKPGDKDTYLTLRILSARCANTPPPVLQ